VNKDTTALSKPRKFIVKKRSTSNIAAAAKKQAAHGLGLSPLIDEAMRQVSGGTHGSEETTFPSAPPSAMPPPLDVFHHASMDSLPAKEELDAFLALHMHVDSATSAINRFIDYKFDQIVQVTIAEHDKTLKTLHTSVGEVLDKINGIDEQYCNANGSLDSFKNEMNDKMMNLANMLQEKVLNPMGRIIETNAQLDKSVNKLIAHVVKLEKNQKEINDAVASKTDRKPEQPITFPLTKPNQNPALSSNPSPNHSYSNHDFAVSYPASYDGSHATSASSHVYQYIPYSDPFTNHAPPYTMPQGWNGQFMDASFAKLPKEQRVQRIQARHGDVAQLPTHPAYRNSGHHNSSDADFSKDGSNGA
jgi:hypothetical protein